MTKASVSKWETGQSMPDVLILPKLASFLMCLLMNCSAIILN
ncbi:helix-turn-helix transcriptional regulator [Enterococcus lactis]